MSPPFPMMPPTDEDWRPGWLGESSTQPLPPRQADARLEEQNSQARSPVPSTHDHITLAAALVTASGWSHSPRGDPSTYPLLGRSLRLWEQQENVSILNISVKALPSGGLVTKTLWPQRKTTKAMATQTVGIRYPVKKPTFCWM